MKKQSARGVPKLPLHNLLRPALHPTQGSEGLPGSQTPNPSMPRQLHPHSRRSPRVSSAASPEAPPRAAAKRQSSVQASGSITQQSPRAVPRQIRHAWSAEPSLASIRPQSTPHRSPSAPNCAPHRSASTSTLPLTGLYTPPSTPHRTASTPRVSLTGLHLPPTVPLIDLQQHPLYSSCICVYPHSTPHRSTLRLHVA